EGVNRGACLATEFGADQTRCGSHNTSAPRRFRISRRGRRGLFALAAAALVLMLASAGVVRGAILQVQQSQTDPTTTTFVSDLSWQVFDVDPATRGAIPLGSPQHVCLNTAYPANCPTDATIFGYGGAGWGADRGPIPGASWIWAPGVTP